MFKLNFGDILNNLIGKEATIEIEGTGGKMPVKVKAELTDKGRLNLNSQQTVKTNIGEVSIKFIETFELSPDGNTLKATRELQPSKGLPITEMFVAKKQSEENVVSKKDGTVNEARDLKMQFSEGVLNGKAKHLEIPPYPNAASARRVTGQVPVRVIFDEEGKVIFAQAIFGHPLLKNAAIEAAIKSTFEPVELNGKIIKVSGIILYNFRP